MWPGMLVSSMPQKQITNSKYLCTLLVLAWFGPLLRISIVFAMNDSELATLYERDNNQLLEL